MSTMVAVGICHNIYGRVRYGRFCYCGCGGEGIAAATMLGVAGIMVRIVMETVLVKVLPSRCHHFTSTTATTASHWSLE